MAYPYRVVTADETVVAKAETIADATVLLAAYYLREGLDLFVMDDQGVAHAEVSKDPTPEEPLQPLVLDVGEVTPMTYSFRVQNVFEEAMLDFRDGTSQVAVVDDTPIDHTFESPGGYRVRVEEGVRSAELLLTISAPPPEPEEPEPVPEPEPPVEPEPR